MRKVYLSLLSILGCVRSVVAADPIESLFKQRSGLSGEIVATTRNLIGTSRPDRRYNIWFHGRKLRTDVCELDQKGEIIPTSCRSFCRECDGEGLIMVFSQQRKEEPTSIELMSTERAGRLVNLAVDPRLLGLTPNDLANMSQAGADEFWRPTTPVALKNIKRDNHSLTEFYFQTARQANWRVLIDPSKNGQPIEMDLWYEEAAARRYFVRSELTQVTAPIAWFPKRVEIQSWLRGKPYTHTVTELIQISLAAPGPRAFTLAGMPANPGQYVSAANRYPAGALWDGTKIVPNPPTGRPPREVVSVPRVVAPSRNRWLIATVCFGVFLIALVIWRGATQKKAG